MSEPIPLRAALRIECPLNDVQISQAQNDELLRLQTDLIIVGVLEGRFIDRLQLQELPCKLGIGCTRHRPAAVKLGGLFRDIQKY